METQIWKPGDKVRFAKPDEVAALLESYALFDHGITREFLADTSRREYVNDLINYGLIEVIVDTIIPPGQVYERVQGLFLKAKLTKTAKVPAYIKTLLLEVLAGTIYMTYELMPYVQNKAKAKSIYDELYAMYRKDLNT